MRRIPLIPAVVSVVGLVAVALVGCSASTSASCVRPDADRPVLDAVTVSDDFSAVPGIDVYAPFRASETAVRDIVTGTGPAIQTDDQIVAIDLTIVNGETGETALEQKYEPFQLAQLVPLIPALSDALHCATEGTRTVLALAPGDIEEQSAASIGITADSSAVAVIDVHKVYLAHADGADVFQSGFGVPSVVRAPDGRPGVTIPDAAAPADLVVQTLKHGDGPVVTGDVPVRVHYTGIVWETREVFQTTWDSEPASLTLSAVVPGFAAALDGQTVGSQVLVVIPPDQGYGDQAQGAIPANSTLVFVIDVLGLDDAPTP